MVEILRHRDIDGEFEGVATARNQSRRHRRGHDSAIALAAILLPPMAHGHILSLDHGDFLGVFRLTAHLVERAGTGRAASRVRGQLVLAVDDRQRRLFTRAVPTLHGWLINFRGLPRTFLRRWREDFAL
jgi:hypothetical protein